MQRFLQLAFLLPALIAIMYFLFHRKRWVLYVLPAIYVAIALFLNVPTNAFAAEEGNLVFLIAAAWIFLILYDIVYKRSRSLNFLSGLLMLVFVIMNMLLLLIGKSL